MEYSEGSESAFQTRRDGRTATHSSSNLVFMGTRAQSASSVSCMKSTTTCPLSQSKRRLSMMVTAQTALKESDDESQ